MYIYLLLSTAVFKLKDNVYVSEFEIINLDDGYVGMAAVLSDMSALYIFSDSSNVRFSFRCFCFPAFTYTYFACLAWFLLAIPRTFG